MTENKLEITKMLTLSGMHIRPETRRMLENEITDSEFQLDVYEKEGFGWFIYLNEEPEENLRMKYPDLCDCIAVARENDCGILCIDADAEPVSFLPAYKDEEATELELVEEIIDYLIERDLFGRACIYANGWCYEWPIEADTGINLTRAKHAYRMRSIVDRTGYLPRPTANIITLAADPALYNIIRSGTGTSGMWHDLSSICRKHGFRIHQGRGSTFTIRHQTPNN